MLEIILSNRFKKDLKLAAKRGYDLELLSNVVDFAHITKKATIKIQRS